MVWINESLNDFYVDEFSGDMVVLRMWFDVCVWGRMEMVGIYLVEEGLWVVNGGWGLFLVF